ncbi:hypothetical protein PWYN_21065 [Paenibacillus wynnii]|uniref:DinB-like domain-containing protein n=2 Tax=Paenibacillus wynnii TaxID=268407 RepID=A0A098M3L9_9BACL|nr:DinB family protein [Paenibacillus wynnii]KGE17135.1 hypothetical protein PWYN_21065 [Paenibacillus wynnii]
MNTKEYLQRFEDTVNIYLQDLEAYNMEQLLLKPQEDKWSMGQMYLHLIQSAQFMGLRNIEVCRVMDTTPETAEVKTDAGKAVFEIEGFLPTSIQVPPSKEYTPLQPVSKEQLSEGLHLVLKKMREVEPLLAGIPTTRTSPHPRLGALNAYEWFYLTEMHYRHHFLQKKRLEEFLEIKI